MGLIATDKGGGFDPVEPGTHHGVCYGVIDLGTHFNEIFKNSSRKALLMWEIPALRIDVERDGQRMNMPRVVSKRYTLSLNKKANLRKELESWRGRPFTDEELAGFDLGKLLGVNCMINVIHEVRNGKTFANVAAVTPLMRGLQKVEPETPKRYFSFDDHTEIPQDLPPWVIAIIQESDEYRASCQPSQYPDQPPPFPEDGEYYGQPQDDLPF